MLGCVYSGATRLVTLAPVEPATYMVEVSCLQLQFGATGPLSLDAVRWNQPHPSEQRSPLDAQAERVTGAIAVKKYVGHLPVVHHFHLLP